MFKLTREKFLNAKIHFGMSVKRKQSMERLICKQKEGNIFMVALKIKNDVVIDQA